MEDIRKFLEEHNIKPRDFHYYELAITHPSYNADAGTVHEDYERLEYMGDAVLGFVSADLIFHNHPELDQGNMSKLRSFLVKSASLSNYSRKIGLYKYIKTGHSINEEQIYQSNKILEDVFEAFIGAIYLDQGIQKAGSFIVDILLEDVKNFDLSSLTDAKTKLQEEMQAEHRDNVHYVLVEQTGPAHDRTFKVRVMFNDIPLAEGIGKSKKAAEEDAAQKALEKRSTL